jgi:hypothetical protein
MAGFLSALSFAAPIGQTLGPALQIGAREQQRQSSEDAFRKMVDQELPTGSDYDAIRQYAKVASPHDVMAALGGDIGKRIEQKYLTQKAGEIWNEKKPDGTEYSDTEKYQRLAIAGVIPWDKFFEFTKQSTKAPPLTLGGMQSAISSWLQSNPNIDRSTRAYAESALGPNATYEQGKSVYEKVIGSYEGPSQYGTRGFSMTGNDNSGRPIIKRYVEPTRGGPAREQTVYMDTGEQVPPENMTHAQFSGQIQDDSGAPVAPPPRPAQGPAGGGASGVPSDSDYAPPGRPAGLPRLRPLEMTKLGAEQKTVTTIQGFLPQISHLRDDMNAIGQERWNRDVPTRAISEFIAAKLDILPGTEPKVAGQQAARVLQSSPDYQQLQINDPDLAYVTSEVITADAIANAALLGSSGTRSAQFLDRFTGHIMTATGNWGSIMTNIETLDAHDGPYRPALRALGIVPSTPDPPDVSPAARLRRGGGSSASATQKMDRDDDAFINKFHKKK